MAPRYSNFTIDAWTEPSSGDALASTIKQSRMVGSGRKALAGIQERGQALALDLPQISRQDLFCNRSR